MGIRFKIAGALVGAFLSITAFAQPIRIGMTGPMSGPAADFGIDAQRGMQLAVEEINARGGIQGRPLEIVLRDDEGQPPKAQTFAKELVHKEGVVAFWASTLTTSNLAAMGVTTAAKVPHIVAGTTSDVICPDASTGKACNPYVFRFAVLNSLQAEKLVDFAVRDLKARRIAILYDSTEYGQDGHKMLLPLLEKMGIKPVYSGTFDLSEKNFKPHMTAIQQAGADAILTWSLGFSSARVALERKQLGMDRVAILGPEALTAADYRKLGGDAVEGTYISARNRSMLSDPNPRTQALAERYVARFKSDPAYAVPFTALSYYDSVHMVAKVMEKVGPDRTKLMEGLEAFGPYTGPTGLTYTFGKGVRNGRGREGVVMIMLREGRQVDAVVQK